jgi:hypothetical protein
MDCCHLGLPHMQQGMIHLLHYSHSCIQFVPHAILTWMPCLLIWGHLSELGLTYQPLGTVVTRILTADTSYHERCDIVVRSRANLSP